VCLVAAALAGPELVTRLTITLWGSFVPALIALYSVARHATLRVALAGAAVMALALAVVMLRVPSVGTAANIPFSFVPCIVVFIAGRMLRARHDRHLELSARARELEAGREETIRAAIADERNRIARELHDIVAHCISVMVVQAGAAEDLLERNPARAEPALRLIQETGRQAVAELSRLLGLLRGGQAELALRPQPGTAQLPELVEGMAEAGLPVTLEVQGTPRPLPPGVELTVYRVAQEALTNTLKHAGPARAQVVLCYSERTVDLDVLDDGRAVQAPGTGHGLIGMRERAALYGGSLTAGPGPGGGFAVRMVLPADGAAT
jgi:signal transduction histidine kinase